MEDLVIQQHDLVNKLLEHKRKIYTLEQENKQLVSEKNASPSQSNTNSNLEQQLKYQDDMINSLRILVQSKENEIDHLKKISQLEREYQELKYKQEGNHQQVEKMEDGNDSKNVINATTHQVPQNSTNQQCSSNSVDGITVKREAEDSSSISCTFENKKKEGVIQ